MRLPLESAATLRLTVSQSAPPGGSFTPGCFDAWIGETVPIIVDEPPFRGAAFTLLSYQLADHGTSVLLEVEAESAMEQDVSLPRESAWHPAGSHDSAQAGPTWPQREDQRTP